jgi:hypothetical protein
MDSIQPETTAPQPGVHQGAVVSIMSGIAAVAFSSNPQSAWHGLAWPLCLLAIATGAYILRGGHVGGKIALTGLVLGTIALCTLLIEQRAALTLVGGTMLVQGWCTYRKAKFA